MSKSIKLLAVLGLVGVLAACGNNNNDDEFVLVEPVSEEPTFTGKLK
jgi:hypothetical protein